jgi:hypothetical protein
MKKPSPKSLKRARPSGAADVRRDLVDQARNK